MVNFPLLISRFASSLSSIATISSRETSLSTVPDTEDHVSIFSLCFSNPNLFSLIKIIFLFFESNGKTNTASLVSTMSRKYLFSSS